MKHWIYSIILAFVSCLSATAQQHQNHIESVRAAFITQKLDLTAEESQKFWPVYNEYQQELKQLMMERNKQRKAGKDDSDHDDELEIETQVLELRKRYRDEFSKVLPPKKAVLVYPAEREFRQQLIRQLKDRKQKN